MNINELIEIYGKPYSEELDIDLKSCSKAEICKWFLASILFGARINEKIAVRTYHEFEKRGILTAEKISGTEWHNLVAILDAGGYARYDFKTADKLLEVFTNLKNRYDGDLNRLHKEAQDCRDLEDKLKLGKGIGNVTIAIFLRDMRYCWEKADPKPTSYIQHAMKNLDIADLKFFSLKYSTDIVQLETALMRFGRNQKKKGR